MVNPGFIPSSWLSEYILSMGKSPILLLQMKILFAIWFWSWLCLSDQLYICRCCFNWEQFIGRKRRGDEIFSPLISSLECEDLQYASSQPDPHLNNCFQIYHLHKRRWSGWSDHCHTCGNHYSTILVKCHATFSFLSKCRLLTTL